MVSPVTVILVYIFSWWIILLLVLPFGIRQPEEHGHGHSHGAPAKTHLKRKLLATTLITAVLVFLFFYITDGMLILPTANQNLD